MSYTIQSITNQEPQKIFDYGTAVSNGMIADHAFTIKFGYNADIDIAATETIWSVGGLWQPAAAAQTVDVTSSSTEDTMTSGTGAWMVAIFGLDTNYNEISELTLQLDGTNGVTSVNSYRVINRVAVSY